MGDQRVRAYKWRLTAAIFAVGAWTAMATPAVAEDDAAAIGQGVRGGLEGFYDFVEPGLYAAREFLGGLFDQAKGKDPRHEQFPPGSDEIPLNEQKAPSPETSAGSNS